MKDFKKQNLKVAVVAGGALFIADMMTKMWATSLFFKPLIFIKRFFYLTIQVNSGIAFGIPMPTWAQIIASLVILFFLVKIGKEYVFAKKKRQFLKPALFGIILGGALGNLVNRIILGYVIDFIALRPLPVFNIADIGITVGLVLLFATSLIDIK